MSKRKNKLINHTKKGLSIPFILCIDQYSCAQYICGYLTKNEAGISKLLKAVNDECNNLKQMEKLNKLAGILDKHREVSVQEAVYRLLGLAMTKSSVKVKYISSGLKQFSTSKLA